MQTDHPSQICIGSIASQMMPQSFSLRNVRSADTYLAAAASAHSLEVLVATSGDAARASAAAAFDTAASTPSGVASGRVSNGASAIPARKCA